MSLRILHFIVKISYVTCQAEDIEFYCQNHVFYVSRSETPKVSYCMLLQNPIFYIYCQNLRYYMIKNLRFRSWHLSLHRRAKTFCIYYCKSQKDYKCKNQRIFTSVKTRIFQTRS